VPPENIIYFVAFAGSLSFLFTSFQSSNGNSFFASDKTPSLYSGLENRKVTQLLCLRQSESFVLP
jgi:hypothetical protein